MGCLGAINVVLIHRTASLQHALKNLFPSGTDKAGSNLSGSSSPHLAGLPPPGFWGRYGEKEEFPAPRRCNRRETGARLAKRTGWGRKLCL